MKKKEWLAVLIIALAAALMLVLMRIMPKNQDSSLNPDGSMNMPSEKAKGEWIAVVNRGRVILYFDSGINAEYTVEGNISEMVIEVAEGSWHVKDVACYDYTCKNMGWVSMDSILPIICLPNDIVIIDAETAENMISEAGNGN